MPSGFAPPPTDATAASTTTGIPTRSDLSSALARSSSPAVQQWTCPCLNIRLSLAPGSSPNTVTSSANANRSPWLAELVSDNAIHIQFPSLTSRETVSLSENTNIACAKCLNCDTVVYAASKPAPPRPARAVGFNTSSSASGDAAKESSSTFSPSPAKPFSSPSRDSTNKVDRLNPRSSEPVVRPLDRRVWILPDTLDPQQASNVAASQAFSPAFNILVPRPTTSLPEKTAQDTAVAVALDHPRDTTPTRPSAGPHTRTSSYSSNTSNIAYALPAVPQHLITSPPLSPRVGAPSSTFPSSANAPTSPGVGASPAPSNLGSSSNPLFTANPLASQLDSVAIERLKDVRSKAEAEVFELVRQKRREMELLEKRFREEAESLLAVTKLPKQSKSSSNNDETASMIEKALLEQQPQQQQQQQQPQSPSASRRANTSTGSRIRESTTPPSSAAPADTTLTSTGYVPPRAITVAQGNVSNGSRRDSLTDEYSDLPPSAFERRPTYSNYSNATPSTTNAGAQNAAASSLGGLSASFAMRGRDLPPQMQDWAEKRRLRERYPQGDHSALPSAANSTANSTANSATNSIVDSEEDAWLARAGRSAVQEQRRTRDSSINTKDDAEMDSRGRGRQPSGQRGGSSSREPREPRRSDNDQQQQQPLSNATRSNPDRMQPSEAVQESGRGRAGRPAASTFNPPLVMSSSLLAKRPAMAYVDDGRNADENTPSVGGKLISSQSVAEPSAQVTLRPRDPPPSSAEPLKPATRSTTVSADVGSRGRTSGSGSSSNLASAPGGRGQESPKSRKAAEKKVAFAETEDRVDHMIVSEDEEGDDDDAEARVRRSNGGPAASRAHEAKPPMVDESADAVFEIDEEAEDLDVDEDDNGEGMQVSTEESDRHKIEMSQSGLRTGASGRPRGQGDDALPGFEDEAVNHPSSGRGQSSGSLSDDFRSSSSDDDEDAVPPGFGAASFSALAASQSAMHSLASSLARARADDASFDPASLRMDGRVVVPPPSAANRDLEPDPETFVVGSLRSSSRRMSVQLPTSAAPSSRQGRDATVGEQPQLPGSVTGSSRRQRSSSRSRISNMSKEDADTEVRLSGLLAPNAPSHRSLWSPKEAKARRAGKHKYKLDDEDNLKWDLWKRKVGSDDAGALATADTSANGTGANVDARATPMAVAPPTQYIAASSGIGPRPLREATMIDPDYSSSINAFSAFDRHLQARAAAAAAAQPAATVSGGLSIGKRTWGYGSFKDDTSGFETEPKTSLPYKEKMMVPSLRKAQRRSIFEPQPHAKLETIPDADDASSSVSASKSTAPSGTSAVPISRDTAATGAAPVAASATCRDAEHKGALPGSVITRGFHMPGAGAPTSGVASGSEAPKPVAVPSATPTGLGIPSVRTSNKSTVVPGEHVTRDAAVGPSLPGSGAATPSSFGRRSPRPPYVAPPPPTSATTVLESDPAQHPRPLQLFQTPADTSFRLHEEGEEEETDEGWTKVLKFMHVVEQLKTNKRTGWLHHRVPTPESIADHMYRMAMLSLLCPAEADVDLGKCVQLAIVHDLAEAEVGDLTPLDGVHKHEKMRREKEAIQYFVHDLLGSSAAGLRIEALWEEYEARQTKESKLVKDLDRFELSLQAIEYERRYGIDDLQAFWEGSIPHVGHPRIRRWAEELAKERQELWKQRGRGYEQE